MSSRSLGLFAGLLVSQGISSPAIWRFTSSGSSVRNRMRPLKRTVGGFFSTFLFSKGSITKSLDCPQHLIFYAAIRNYSETTRAYLGLTCFSTDDIRISTNLLGSKPVLLRHLQPITALFIVKKNYKLVTFVQCHGTFGSLTFRAAEDKLRSVNRELPCGWKKNASGGL